MRTGTALRGARAGRGCHACGRSEGASGEHGGQGVVDVGDVVGEVHADLGGVEMERAVAQGQVPGGDHVHGVGEAFGDVVGKGGR